MQSYILNVVFLVWYSWAETFANGCYLRGSDVNGIGKQLFCFSTHYQKINQKFAAGPVLILKLSSSNFKWRNTISIQLFIISYIVNWYLTPLKNNLKKDGGREIFAVMMSGEKKSDFPSR